MDNLPALPAGWTRDRVYAASGAEMAALPPADHALIRSYLESESSLVAASAGAPHDSDEEGDSSPTEELARIAAEVGLLADDLTGDFADVAHTMINDGLDVWGFVVFKTWGFGAGTDDAVAWDSFWRRWIDFMDAQLRANGATGDLRAGLAGKLRWKLVEDERLAGASVPQVRQAFADLVEDEEALASGLDLDMCLVIDEASVKSLLNDDASDESVPFVTGVARDLDSDEPRDEGFFRIAMDTLIPDVWYLLSIMSPAELDPGDGAVYRGILTHRDLDDMDTDDEPQDASE
ncbi:MAG: hypothetical protein M1818_004911 [Claussenomyces sp. TS43310]|nr:MAG: hypothetical protein M1818_004911 [Claussenomyces sp. TS43310]